MHSLLWQGEGVLKFGVNYTSPIGNLVIHATDHGLCSVLKSKPIGKEVANAHLLQAVDELNEYFSGLRTDFDVSLDIMGTEFQRDCWKELVKIPFGETISYLDLAKRVATSKHCRAVANANNKNKLPIFIPCHRVIGSDGSLTGFAWGLDIKEFLLKKEGAERESAPSTHKRENTFIK